MSSKGEGYSSVPERKLVRIDDLRFDGGMYSVKNGVLIPRNCSTQTKNVIADEHYALTKMPGIELLVTEANNRFADNPGYLVFTFVTPEGQEKLITVAHDSNGDMKVWALDTQSSYPAAVAPTDITPTGGLVSGVRPCLWMFEGKMYLTNGVDPLMRWDGSTTWEKYSTDKSERFICGTFFDSSLFLGGSIQHPNRVAFALPGADYLKHYYAGTYDPNYAARTYSIDIPARQGDRILWLLDFYGALVVLKTHSIWAIYGSPVADTHSLKCLSETRGVVDGATVQIRGDHILFVEKRGVDVYGNTSVVVSNQDQKLLTQPNIIRLTQPIQNWWDDQISVSDPLEFLKIITWTGYENFCQTIAFDNGSSEIEVDDEIFIGGMVKRALVRYVDVDSGTWAGGDAVGTLYITRLIPSDSTFSDNDNITVGATQSAIVNGDSEPGGRIEEAKHVQCNIAPLSDALDVLNFASRYYDEPSCLTPSVEPPSSWRQQTTVDQFVDLRSYAKNSYNSQMFYMGGMSQPPGAHPGVFIYLKEIGDVSGDTVEVTVNESDDNDEPIFDSTYAEGTLDGDFIHDIFVLKFDAGTSEIFVGETVDGGTSAKEGKVWGIKVTEGTWTDNDAAGYLFIKGTLATGDFTDNEPLNIGGVQHADVDGTGRHIDDGAFVYVPFVYCKYPQNLIWELGVHHCNLAVKVTGDDDSNYLQWGYNSAGGLDEGQMVNSDGETPTSQSDCDYAFILATMWYYHNKYTSYVVFAPYQAPSDLINWKKIEIELEDKTLEDYVRHSIIDTVYYEVRDANSGWGSWTLTTNGGAISGTGRWIALKIRFCRPSGVHRSKMDSFSMPKIKLTYYTQNEATILHGSAIYKDRYYVSAKIVDPDQAEA